jgi:hypothetical protein
MENLTEENLLRFVKSLHGECKVRHIIILDTGLKRLYEKDKKAFYNLIDNIEITTNEEGLNFVKEKLDEINKEK